ncbi:MAG TPA: deoxyribose-phosphate aldolase, partial [Candidatus Krumholzibacterium sp.]|nr:deoxyribose-phosphate aldolase [Candidatus Krumholzibacterium sp.]
MTGIELNRLIDHTLLRPDATDDDIRKICDEAKEWGFFSVCVNTHFVPLVAGEVQGTGIMVCSIAGFPLGAVDSKVKAFEAHRAVEQGAGEIDMVMNVGALKAG